MYICFNVSAGCQEKKGLLPSYSVFVFCVCVCYLCLEGWVMRFGLCWDTFAQHIYTHTLRMHPQNLVHRNAIYTCMRISILK